MKDTKKSLRTSLYATGAKSLVFALSFGAFACAGDSANEQSTLGMSNAAAEVRTELLAHAAPNNTSFSVQEANEAPTPIKVNIPAATDKLLTKVMAKFNTESGFSAKESETGTYYEMSTAQGGFQCLADKIRMNIWKRNDAMNTVREAVANGNLAGIADVSRAGFAMDMRWLNAQTKDFQTNHKLGVDRTHQVVSKGGNSKVVGYYKELVYNKIYSNVDIRYARMDNGALAYDVVLYPNADLSAVRFTLDGADGVSIAENGNLSIQTAIGDMTQSIPVAYQMNGTEKVAVEASFVVNADGSVGFKLGEYNTKQPVVIGTVVMDWSAVAMGDEAYGLSLSSHPQGGKMLMGAQLLPAMPAKVGAYEMAANEGYTNFLIQLSDAGEVKNITYFATR